MIETNYISPDIIKATEVEVQRNPVAKKVYELNMAIDKKQHEVIQLEIELMLAMKTNPLPVIRWRESIMWCLEVDSENDYFFLKSTVSVYKCVAFKHGIELTSDIRNKIATTLSALFMEKNQIGRIKIGNTLYYGLRKFFEDDCETLIKEFEHKKDLLRS